MKLDEFTEALNEALIQRGVPEHIASLNVEKLTAHLNSDSFRVMDSYSSKEELSQMADELSERLLRHLQTKEGAASSTPKRTDEQQKLDSLNDALNRAVRSTEDGVSHAGNVSHASSASRTDDTSLAGDASRADVIGIIGTPAPEEAPEESIDGITDIERTATSDVTEIIFDDDDDVIELSASPERRDSLSGNTVFTAPASSDGTAAPEAHFEGDLGAHPDDIAAKNTISFSLPADDIGEYAPDAAMLTSMGLADSTYEAEVIETRGQKGNIPPTLPPLPEIYESAKGKKKFKTAVICASPLIAVAVLAYFAAWALVFVAEAALIAGLIAALVATAAAGTLASITGIIYGIVKLSTRHGEGVFEIGLGIVIAGATLLAGILIYNAALRFMPWAIKRTAYLFRFCSRCIRIRIRQTRGRFSEK